MEARRFGAAIHRVVAGLLLFLTLPVSAQGLSGIEQSGVAVYRYTELGQSAITVDLLGSIGRTGRYLVEPGMSVRDLIVLGGGGLPEGGPGETVGTLSLVREVDGARSVVYSAPLSEIAETGDSVVLEDGDLVTIRTVAPGAIEVDVWGAAGQTGRVPVPPESTLLDVLAEAGGPALPGRGAEAVIITLLRVAGGARAVVYEGTLAELAASTPPVVQEGDIVTVRVAPEGGFTWRDALQVITTVGSFVLLIDRIGAIL